VPALVVGLCCGGETLYPGPEWEDRPNPLADPRATVGGEISIFAGQSPNSLNYYLDNNTFSASAFGAMYETLLDNDPVTLDYVPGLAERWSISEDKASFTFWIDPEARWSDGRPVTAADVDWTYRTVMDPANLTGVHKVALERFEPPEVLDRLVIRFTAKQVHWSNLGAVGGFHVLPRHAFQDLDFNKVNFEFPVVSGLYCLGEIREGLYIKLERRSDWWRRHWLSVQHTGNFQTLKFRFYAARENAFEAFRKGMIDLYPIYTARLWINETVGERFDRNWILKQKIHNAKPVGFQGFAMNTRRPPFDDVRVRKALALLLDRETMNRRLMYDQYFLHRSYYEDLYSAETPCPNPVTPFDPDAARGLLRDAGWVVNPDTGYLEKGGRPFEISFLTRDPSSDRFLAIYGEALKDVGISLSIDRKDWAAWVKDMEEFNFGMTWAAWGAGVFKDPEGMWSSREAERHSGNNITGFQDPEVDRLIEEQKILFDVAERHRICRRIDEIVFAEHPYALLWNLDYTRLLYWNKFGTPRTVLSKYGDESSAYWYWWLDPDSVADLEHAMATEQTLPPVPRAIHFEDEFP
jgi:microcin C transport system substrate-binding protein